MSLLEPREAQRLEEFGSRLQHRIQTAASAKVRKVSGRLVDLDVLQIYPGEAKVVLRDVPVVHLGTATIGVRIGLEVGAEGLVVFHRLDPSETYRLNEPVEIKNLREHGFYPEFFPRCASEDSPGEWPASGEISVGLPDASVELRVTADAITVKAPTVNLVSDSPGDYAALASKTEAALDVLKSALDQVATELGAAAAGMGVNTGSTTIPPLLATFDSSVASDKVGLE